MILSAFFGHNIARGRWRGGGGGGRRDEPKAEQKNVLRSRIKNKSMLQICVENNNNKTTDLMLVPSPYFFLVLELEARTC